jgi:hypothetical protein
LSCDSNQIHTIVDLPTSLLELHISNNQLTNLKNISDSVEDLHVKNNFLKVLKVIPRECVSLDARNNFIQTVKVTKCFKNIRDIQLLGNNIDEVDKLLYKLNKLDAMTDLINEDDSQSESEIDFENMSNPDNVSDLENESNGGNISIEEVDDESSVMTNMMEGEEEITPEQILQLGNLNQQNSNKKAL